MLTLDQFTANIASGTKLDLTDTAINRQVTQFLTQLNSVANPDTEIEEGETFSLVANSGDGNFLVSSEGTSFEVAGEAADEIDFLDLFSLDDIDFSEIDLGDLELDEDMMELIGSVIEDPDMLEAFQAVVDAIAADAEIDEEGDGEEGEGEGEGEGEDAVTSAVDDYKEKLASQLEEMDEMLAIGDLSAQAQKEIQERYSKVQTLRSMESESLLTLMKAMLSINSTLNAMIKSHNDEMKQTFSR